MSVLIDLQHVTMREPDRALFEDLSVAVSDGDRLGIVGINGTGKSTLLRVMAGLVTPDRGEIRRGRGMRTSFLGQAPVLSGSTVREAIGEGWEAEAALDRLGMSAHIDRAIADLSGGQAKRVALAAALAAPSELLILDEPTNDLDLETLRVLEDLLDEWPGTLIVVSHDRAFLDRMIEVPLALSPSGALAPVPGGVAAWVAAQGRNATTAPAKVPAASTTTRTSPRSVVGARAGRRLRELVKELAKLARQVERLTEQLLATTDHVEMRRLGDELGAVRAEITVAEEEWLEVAEASEAP